MSPFSGQEKRRAPHPRDIVREVPVSDFLSPLEYLSRVYHRTKEKSFGYSYLDFAQDLGFPRSNVLRLMIVGQRPFSMKSAERIVEALSLQGIDKKYFLTLARHGISRVSHERDELFKELVALKTKKSPQTLSPIQAEYFSEWYHPVIREIIGVKQFSGDPAWIQEKLHFVLRMDEIKKSLELLEKLKYITYDTPTGRWKKTEENILTDDEVDSLAMIRYHQKMIEIGKESIVQLSEDQREIRAATLRIPASLIPVLKAKIGGWVHELLALEVQPPPQTTTRSPAPHETPQDTSYSDQDEQVVQVNVQFFAFTKSLGMGKREEGK